ncbi:gamma-glutamyltransferase [Methylophaga sp.]|uniref:gamma-glutamyltransferase n=1 Tax=Methylophaga sp. TaxID=2024840 RepID=UPI001400C1D9|nr:gamma-glutamyltransferase [Methylophaga sp.]MTI62662.1 gamma-glutamyltransferase [Methylophaga sp.]
MRHLFLSLCLCLITFSSAAQTRPAAIASAHPLATQAGFEILQQGGNAFDAAVAITAALAVVEPAGSGLGGGGFWLLHRAKDNHQVMIDGREMAPGNAHKNMYLDAKGQFQPTLPLNGPLAAGIPGIPAGLVHLSQKYGSLPLSTSLQPAIDYAEKGFTVTEGYQHLVGFRRDTLRQYPEAAAIFLDQGKVPAIGSQIHQPDLAITLKTLANEGHDGFYQGDIADKLVQSVQAHGGIWTRADLGKYQIIERQPVTGQYRGYAITSAALPSSGGIVLMLALNQLAAFDLHQADSTQRRHWVVEAMRRAYYDRSRYLGDADFIAIPDYLTKPAYGLRLSRSIDDKTATPSQALPVNEAAGENTTHFSVIDQHGNRVAATLSINYPFGSGFVAEGTGVLLNDEMDDFSAKEGTANVYGLVGNEANAIEPYKRPLSSMSPTFIENDERLMITGTPGGSRIISMVLLSLLDFVDGDSADEIVAAPRYHHQYLPDHIQLEKDAFSEAEIHALQQRGHEIKQLNRRYGDMQILIVNKQNGQLDAASDPRGEGLAEVKLIKP